MLDISPEKSKVVNLKKNYSNFLVRIYQTCVFNGNALIYDWPNILALVVFALLPLLVARSIRKAYSTYVYLP